MSARPWQLALKDSKQTNSTGYSNHINNELRHEPLSAHLPSFKVLMPANTHASKVSEKPAIAAGTIMMTMLSSGRDHNLHPGPREQKDP